MAGRWNVELECAEDKLHQFVEHFCFQHLPPSPPASVLCPGDSIMLKRTAVAAVQVLAWHSQLGCGALLWNITNSTEHQPQTRPLCDGDGSR